MVLVTVPVMLAEPLMHEPYFNTNHRNVGFELRLVTQLAL
jgi:hypothetical protein